MKIFLSGIACVGKTTVGEKLALLLDFEFIDLNGEIEKYFGTSLARVQHSFLTAYSYRKEAAKVLHHVLVRENLTNCVIALPPSGLMDSFWRLIKREEGIIVVLHDSPENILKRIVIYDMDSKPIDKQLSSKEKGLCLEEIKEDISYFRRTYRRADLTVTIAGLGPEEAARRVKNMLAELPSAKSRPGSERGIRGYSN